MSKLDRLKKLPGSKTTGEEKPAIKGDFALLVKELQNISLMNKQSNEDIVKSIDQLSKVIVIASDEGMNVEAIVKAIEGLKTKLDEKKSPNIPVDYEINFERDRNMLMKSGIRLTSVPKKLNKKLN